MEKKLLIMLMLSIMFFSACEPIGEFNFLAVLEPNSFVYCNDYEFTCCNEQRINYYDYQWGTRTSDIYTCDGSSNRCAVSFSISDAPGLTLYKAPSINGCTYNSGIFVWQNQYTCAGEQPLGRTFNGNIMPGEVVYLRGTAHTSSPFYPMHIDVYKNRIDFCGDSGCSVGVPVSGADKCTFQTANNIYGSSGQIIKQSTSTISYTVPSTQCVLSYAAGNRHICGDKTEQCTVNDDCTGHTYGRYECTGRTLQEYGCRQLPDPNTVTDYDIGWTLGKDLSYTATRCEIISAKQVQCCGDTDCGSNAFCDRSTWTCKQDVQCQNDYDCGVSQVCDWTTKKLKTPDCSNNMCGYSESAVECCLDVNCPTGYFCGTDRTCKQSSIPKTECPYGCCVYKLEYFDKPCVSGQTCCGDSVCRADCTTAPPDPEDQKNKCEASVDDGGDGGKWVCQTTNPEWYEFWKSSTTSCNCLTPHFSVAGVLLITVGLVLIFVTRIPPLMILGGLSTLGGIALMILSGIGLI